MNLPLLRKECELIGDWWSIRAEDLNRLAVAVLGPRIGGWVRQGTERSTIAKIKFGALAVTLPQELAALARDARRIQALGGADSSLKAVAYYHVRFENIHPLHDGNGRVGRILLTGQIYQACKMEPAKFEWHLIAQQGRYRVAFRAKASTETYRQLVLLLSEIAQIKVADATVPDGFSLEPLHQSPGRPRSQ